MNNPTQRLPSIRAMLALERVAHLGSVTRAAEHLNTSQSAVSRHLRQIESDLGVALVMRDGRGIVLTPVGQAYAREVAEVLTRLRDAGDRAGASRHQLTIACTHEVSHLILMPRYGELKDTLGQQTHIRIVTCDYPAIPAVIDAGADIVFEYRRVRPDRPAAAIVTEEIIPVAAPDFLDLHRSDLAQPPGQWARVPRLALTKDNSGWATWEDWFTAQGTVPPRAREHLFDNYVYALEAAARGEGLVLAWRGFADRYLSTGQLVPLAYDWLDCGTTLYATPTPNGLPRKLVRKCLRALSRPPR